MPPVDYTSNNTPKDYVCESCGATGVKLWRDYQSISPNRGKCSVQEQKKDYSPNAQGYVMSKYGRTDQIGWKVPAIPTEEGDAYWGYGTVPQEGANWWRTLPTGKVGEE